MVICSKTEDIDFDDEFRKEKKKKMLADLFGSNEETKVETKPSLSTSAAPSQSDWLDLKDDSQEKTLPANLTHSTKTSGFETEPQENFILNTPSTLDRRFSTTVPEVSEKTVHFVDNSGTSSRKISESSPAIMRKSKPRFKSLDLNLDFEFDSISQDELVTKPQNTSVEDGVLLELLISICNFHFKL